MKNFLLLTLVLFYSVAAQAQVKYEQEKKVAANEVPELSQAWLEQAFPAIKKAKWYKGVTAGKTSYVARFKSKGSRYSMSFSESGDIEDVERKVSLDKMPEYQKAQLYLGFSRLKNFKLMTVYEQWTASTSSDLMKAVREDDPTKATLRYTVEFKADIDGKNTLWEGLFAPSGQLLRKREIASSSNR